MGIDKPFVDYSANCGNISSAVGPYAIGKGLVRPEEPFTTVRIYNTNTRKMIHAKVPVKRGKVISDGDYAIDGVPGTGAKIELSFMDPGGASTGKLMPTRNVMDEIRLDTGEAFVVSIVDAGNLTAFIRAADLGLQGTELPGTFDQDVACKTKLEAIREKVADLIGIPHNPSIPKISFVAPPQDFKTMTGMEIKGEEVDLVARVMAMGKMHKTFAITAGIPAAIAAVTPGSIVQQVIGTDLHSPMERTVIIGHPSGQMDVRVEAMHEGDQLRVISCTIGRTAREIMEGKVYISKKIYSSREQEAQENRGWVPKNQNFQEDGLSEK